jgi:tetratricopeptide (TPR) repeat protein
LEREALVTRQRLFGNESQEVIDSLRNLIIILGDTGKWGEAEATAREVLALRRKLLGSQHPSVAGALYDLAWAAAGNGKQKEAEALKQEGFALRQKVSDNYADVAISLCYLGNRMRQRGNLEDAYSVLSAALSLQRKFVGNDHPDTLYTLGNLGLIYEAETNWSKAETVFREVLALRLKRPGNDDPRAMWENGELCHVLVAQRKYREAEQLLAEVLTPAFVTNRACSDLLGRRLDLMGRQARWKEASTDAAALMQFQPTDYYWFYNVAALLAMTHDRPAYEQLCHRIPAAFAETTNPYVAQRIAESCLLLLNSGADLQLVDRLATTAVTLGNGDGGGIGYFQACKALSEYREGSFPEAVEWAEKASTNSEIFVRAKGCAVLAMSQWRLGLKDAARATLSEGNKLAQDISSHQAVDLGEGWINWLVARILLDQATELIANKSTLGNDSKNHH